MEEILMKILEGQNRSEKQINQIQNSLEVMGKDIHSLKSDVKEIKDSVQRIEEHQEVSIMNMLSHIKKQGEVKDSQIQVLNKRLFEVEAKMEQHPTKQT